MKTYAVEVTSIVEVTLDETKFTPEFFAEFNSTISDWDYDLEEHAKHLAWVHATGVEALDGYGAFVEGYGPVKDMGITARLIDTDVVLA